MRRHLLVFTAFATFSTPAFATGGFDCEIDDANLKLNVEGGYSYSLPGFFNVRGELALPAGAAPKGLEKVTITPEMLGHHWFYNRELRLFLHAETEGDLPFGAIDLVVMTAGDADEVSYHGDYALTVSRADADEPARYSGKVVCSAG